MYLASNIYPTGIAKILAGEAGLLSDVQTEYYFTSDEVGKELNRLIQFQQMSIMSPFESCLVAYYGIDLSEKQLNFLQIIYETTHQLLVGQMIDSQLNIIHEQINGIDKPDAGVITQAFHSVIDLIMKSKKQRTAE